MYMTLRIALVAAVALTVFAAEPLPVPATEQIQALDQQMRELLLEREAVLLQLREDNALAPRSERVAREAEYAQMQEQYEIQLMEKMIEYYGLTGNEELRARAEANLEQMLAPAATGTPEPDAQNRSRIVNGEER